MSKTEQFSDLALGSRGPNVTLYRWLYDELRGAILDGRLQSGTKIPSSRSISRQHRVARGTVVSALEQLAAEGYINGRVGSGSFVRDAAPDRLLEVKARDLPANPDVSRATLSDRGRSLSAHLFFPTVWLKPTAPPLRVGQPALGAFPVDLWSRVAARRLRRMSASLISRSESFGYLPLREEIATHLGRFRGIKCTAEQIIVTSGTQQSLDLAARLLLDPGDSVWVEDPGYPGAVAIFRALGASIVPVPVDEQGLVCAVGSKRCKSAKLAYVTPAHQFPMGVTMSLSRRLELLKWAHEEDAWILEDDYDGEFRFAGRPLVALRSLDTRGSVIYANTFNKVLFPTLRLGYLVLPSRLVKSFASAKSIIDRYPPAIDQAILCDFITEGHMGQHIRRMRELYARRLDVLTKSVRLEMDGLMELAPMRAGLQTIGWLKGGVDDIQAYEKALTRGVETVALSNLTIDRVMKPALILGFAATEERTIRRGVEELALVLRELNRSRPKRRGRDRASGDRRPTD
jgi:GntR family transcriptional regulator/MocR family aminotransferase